MIGKINGAGSNGDDSRQIQPNRSLLRDGSATARIARALTRGLTTDLFQPNDASSVQRGSRSVAEQLHRFVAADEFETGSPSFQGKLQSMLGKSSRLAA